MNKVKLIFLMCMSANAFAQSEISPTPKTPLEVVKAFLTAYQQKDHATFSSYLHPDILWIQPGDSRISGVKTSKTELLLMGKKMWEMSDGTIRLEDVQYFEGSGNTVVAILRWTAVHPAGATLNVRNIDVYTVEDGKIVIGKIYSEDVAAENKFWMK